MREKQGDVVSNPTLVVIFLKKIFVLKNNSLDYIARKLGADIDFRIQDYWKKIQSIEQRVEACALGAKALRVRWTQLYRNS